MSDTTMITAEERARLRGILSEHGTWQVEDRIILRLLNTVEQAEANVERLTKERDWLANNLIDCPRFTNCAVDCAECRKEAARKAVANETSGYRECATCKHGGKKYTFFCYVLVKDVSDALDRVEFLRKIGVDPFAQPYREPGSSSVPARALRDFARWVNHKAIFKSVPWVKYDSKEHQPCQN